MRRGAAAALLALVACGTPVAAAETGAEVRGLAARAASGDGAALERLRAVRSVDGRPVDLTVVLDAPPAERARRLAMLAGDPAATTAPTDVRAARDEATDILDQRRFHEQSPPRPFRRPLEWLGKQLETVVDPLGRLVRWLPGGDAVGWAILAGAVALLGAAVATGLVRRRSSAMVERAARLRVGGEDPRELERAAAEAERQGEYERALRLRFRAGLIGLARAGTVPARAQVTTGELRRRLRQPAFEEIADTFDDVVYGGREATAADAREAGERWPRVLEEARR